MQAVRPDDHCSLNVALYGQGARRWCMTERGERHVHRSRSEFVIGPSHVHWDGSALVIDVDEISLPLPRRLRGRVRVHPQGLSRFVTALDERGRHRWGPIGPCSRIEVDFDQPGLSWRGHAYLDSNEGDEPVVRPFEEWDWSRAQMADGSTAVIYDVRLRGGRERVIAQRFAPDGTATPFQPPERQPLPRSLWRVPRTIRTDPGVPAVVQQTLEDTPFYVRSVIGSGLLGERVVSVHETLAVPRLESPVVQGMLPFRMPRRA